VRLKQKLTAILPPEEVLKAYGRKMGPDPASIHAAMMGGILSNNSSGMCCGSEIRALRAAEIYSSSRTCEIGLTRATGTVARSFIHLLERATRQ
jgi:hypothetical protein